MAGQQLLQLNNVDVFQGSFQALWDVSMEINPGEILALIGANTAGKSTLLDTVSGLLHPKKGSITFKGRDITP
jgi:branched-chain amino acid transport system ATP-binding protein